MSANEYRVVWQREGLSRRTALRQTLAGAERLALVLQGRMEEATGRSRDELACCSGRECSCGGETLGEAWEARTRQIPSLVAVPLIESRKVGPWEGTGHPTFERAQKHHELCPGAEDCDCGAALPGDTPASCTCSPGIVSWECPWHGGAPDA